MLALIVFDLPGFWGPCPDRVVAQLPESDIFAPIPSVDAVAKAIAEEFQFEYHCRRRTDACVYYLYGRKPGAPQF